MLDNSEVELVRARTRSFFMAAIESGGGPKAVARELTMLGVAVAERTVASWREGRYFPGADVAFLMSARFQVSLDKHALGEALERTLTDRLDDQERRLERLEARMEGWEIEAALATGQFVSGNDASDPEEAGAARERWRQRFEQLESAVAELREKEA